MLVPVPTATEGDVAEPALNTPDVKFAVVPVTVVPETVTKFAVVPVTVAPVTVPKPARTPVMSENCPACPVIVPPETNVVNTPETPLTVTKFAVVPVVVVPVKDV